MSAITDEDYKRWERERKYRERHLSKKQWDALDSFRHGHGIGEYAYLSWPTAKVLWRLGLIVIGSYWDERSHRSHIVGYTTKRGFEALQRAGKGWSGAVWHEPIKAYGWRPWVLTRAHVRASVTARLRAKKRGLYASRSRAYGLMAVATRSKGTLGGEWPASRRRTRWLAFT